MSTNIIKKNIYIFIKWYWQIRWLNNEIYLVGERVEKKCVVAEMIFFILFNTVESYDNVVFITCFIMYLL